MCQNVAAVAIACTCSVVIWPYLLPARICENWIQTGSPCMPGSLAKRYRRRAQGGWLHSTWGPIWNSAKQLPWIGHDMYIYILCIYICIYSLYLQSFNGVFCIHIVYVLCRTAIRNDHSNLSKHFTSRILLQFNRRKQRGLRSVPHFEQHPHSLRCTGSEAVVDPCI